VIKYCSHWLSIQDVHQTSLEKEKDDVLFLTIDNPDKFFRHSLRVKTKLDKENPKAGDVFSVDGTAFSVDYLDKLVFKAKKEDKFESLLYDKKESGSNDCRFEKKAWAYVDDNTNRVYAVKVLLSDDYSAQVAYYEVPLYGAPTKETRPIRPVEFSSGLPEKSPYEYEAFDQDDTFDDLLIPCEKHISGGTSSAVSLDATSLETLNKLNENMRKMSEMLVKFESVDHSIARLADSFEKLVVVLANKK